MASDERHPLLGSAPLSFTPGAGDAAVTPDVPADMPVLLLLGDGPEARAVARLASECDFAVDMVVWDASEAPAEDVPTEEGKDAPASAPELPGVRRRFVLRPGESPVECCAIGRRHYVCIFPPDVGTATRALDDVLASHAFYVGLWATRAGRARVWAELKEAGMPDAELAAVSCPMGLGELAVNASGPVAAAVAVLAELLAARAGSRQRFRLED